MGSERQVSKKRKPRFSYCRFYRALLRADNILSFEHVRSSVYEIDILVDDAVIDALRSLLPLKEICEIYYATSLFYFKATCFVSIEKKSFYLNQALRYITSAKLYGFCDKNDIEHMIKSYSSVLIKNGLAGEDALKCKGNHEKTASSIQFSFFSEFTSKINRSIYNDADKLFSDVISDFEKKVGRKYFSLQKGIDSCSCRL